MKAKSNNFCNLYLYNGKIFSYNQLVYLSIERAMLAFEIISYTFICTRVLPKSSFCTTLQC